MFLEISVLCNIDWKRFLTFLVGTFSWEPFLGNLLLGTLLGNLFLGTLLGNVFLGTLFGNLFLGTFLGHLFLGTFLFLGTLLGNLPGNLAWEPVSGNLAWERRLGTSLRNFAWEFLPGNLAWEPLLGTCSLGTLLGHPFLGTWEPLGFWLLRPAPGPLLWLKIPSLRCWGKKQMQFSKFENIEIKLVDS